MTADGGRSPRRGSEGASAPGAAEEELAAWAAGLGVPLDDSQLSLLRSYLKDVEEANKKTNITSDSGDDLWLKHLADGIAAIPVLRERLEDPAPRLLDLGAGAGFIGIAIKIAWPEADVTLQDSSRRKFEFLNRTAAGLGVRGLHVVLARADGRPGASSYDAVLARALVPLKEAARLGLPLVEPDGLLLIYQTEEPPGHPRLEAVPYRRPRETADRRLVLTRPGRP